MGSNITEMENVASDTVAVSKVTFDFEFSKWHNGQQMNMDDLLYIHYIS